MHYKDRTADEMLKHAREIGPEEAAQIYSEINYKKHGVVAAFRTSPKKFEEYMRRRRAADEQAKHGLGCHRRRQ